MGRRFWENLGTLALAFSLSVLVWVVAVNEENPVEEKLFPAALEVRLVNMPANLILVSEANTETTVKIRAPQSVWETLVADQIQVTADLADQTPGTHEIPLTARLLNLPLARVTGLNPASIRLTFDSRTTRELLVHVETSGEPARGYEAGTLTLSAATTVVSGPASAVDRVSDIVASISLDGLRKDLDQEVDLIPVDSAGRRVDEVDINPRSVRVLVPITQKQGYRDVAVTVDYVGQVAPGYRITNISVIPPVITVSSSDPQKVTELPGFVRTQPLDITDASDDILVRLALALPEGVTPVGDLNVQVQVSIAAIESSQTVKQTLEVQGLGPGLSAAVSPDSVLVLISGPLPVLDQLQPEDVRAFVDATGLEPGTYQLAPQVSVVSDKVRAESVLPASVEVMIAFGVTPSVTPSPGGTPTPTPTRRP
jgi:YbbR domain-containing protein